jgi:diaminopimelate decarboxylase
MHTGSEIKDIQVFMNSMEVILELVEDFPDVTYIDLGSGFKVPYKPDEKATNVEELASKVLERLSAFEAKSGRSLEVWFEPGKYLVSEAGLFVAKVNIVKTTPATVFIGLNSGFNHLIRPMFYQAHHEIVNLSNPNGAERIYTIVGNLCETDTFAWDRMMTEVKEGDFIGFYNAGAYCFEMSMNYNARTKPAEILVDRDMKPHLIRKPQTFEDLTRDLVLMS